MKILNLFDDIVDDKIQTKHLSPYQKMKSDRNYKKSTDDRKCKTCKHWSTYY